MEDDANTWQGCEFEEGRMNYYEQEQLRLLFVGMMTEMKGSFTISKNALDRITGKEQFNLEETESGNLKITQLEDS